MRAGSGRNDGVDNGLPDGGPAIQDQIARERNDRAVGAGLSLSFPASRDRKHKSGREYFAVTTFYAVFFSEPWPWMEEREALIGGFPTNVVNPRVSKGVPSRAGEEVTAVTDPVPCS